MESKLAASSAPGRTDVCDQLNETRFLYPIVGLFAAFIYLVCIVSPPSLMDDVDAVEAMIPRNMLNSGDWVTAQLDGVKYLEKSPLMYWIMAVFYKIFGQHDWAARIPIALSCIGLALLTAAFGKWAFGRRGGFYAGLCMATCVGLFLFTRVQIPDVMLTLVICLSMWAFLRTQEEEETRPRLWAYVFWISLALGLLLKSLIAIVFPLGAALVYLVCTRRAFSWTSWRRLYPFSGTVLMLLIAVPWHVMATLRNPPTFAFTLHSDPSQYHGFLWFYFINEQLLRFLNLRYPQDYSTVPRVWFWLFHFVWLFPWSVYFPAAVKLSYRAVDRAGRTRLLALCWTGFILVFFTFSSTQEYYSMPCYPALALLLGSAMDAEGKWIQRGTRALTVIAATCAAVVLTILFLSRHFPAPGDISLALTRQAHYKLSLDHMEDLTLRSFAYLRMPLALAGLAFLVGAVGTFRAAGKRAFYAAALMMVLFYQAAQLALVAFDPYLSSRPLATAILKSPPGAIILDTQYWLLSSIPYYTGESVLMLNGRWNNLEYGSYAPGAPNVFLDNGQFRNLWLGSERFYVVTKDGNTPRLEGLVGEEHLFVVARSGGKSVFTNLPLA
jgi:4-amino-4-deoxy-L-arabinose transferase-like glycosyltransferase